MILTRLRLRNFRQHADLDLPLGAGLTAVVGPNGRGKSTLFEAIAWALYGSAASRGTNDTLPRRGTPKGDCSVELEFRLGELTYRVARTLGSAAVYVDDGPAVASGAADSARYLAARIGLSREEFLNTYFTGQKELEFLSKEGPTEKSRFLSRLLGYDRFRAAQERVRADRKTARAKADALAERLAGVPEVSGEALDAARSVLEAATDTLQSVTTHAERARTEKVAAEAEHTRGAALRRADEEVAERIRAAEDTLRDHERGRERASDAVATARAAQEDAVRLREERGALSLEGALAEHEALRAAESRVVERRALSEELARLVRPAGPVDQAASDLARAERSAEELARLEPSIAARAEEARKRRDASAESIEEVTREGSAVAERIRALQQDLAALDEQLDHLDAAGAHADCPTCARPLGEVFDQVVGAARARRDALADEVEVLQAARAGLLERHEEAVAQGRRAQAFLDGLDEERRRAQALRSHAERRDELQERLGALQAREAELRARIEALPTTVDAARLRAVEEILDRGRYLASRIADAERLAAGLDEAEARLSAAEREVARRTEELAALRAERAGLGFDAAAFAAIETRLRDAGEALQTATVARLEAHHARDRAADELATLEARAAERARDEAALEEARGEVRLLDETDRVYTELRHALNDSIRPDLSEIATGLLVEMTAGRFTRLELDEEYRIRVFADGDEEPVISGGEGDVANLSLRLAVSALIARRSGRPLSFLMLDEVFGSLDRERQRRVMDVLTSLSTGRFEQVLVITHSDGVQDAAHQVIDLGAPVETAPAVEAALEVVAA